MEDLILLEYRCSCNHLLFKGIISPGSNLQIKCKNCGNIVSCGSDLITLDQNTDRFIFLLDDQGKILDISPSASRILGYPVTDLKKMSIFNFVSHVDLNDWAKVLEMVDKMPNKVFLSDTIFPTKDGRLLSLRTKFKKHDLNGKSAVIVFYESTGQDTPKESIVLETSGAVMLDLIMEISLDCTILYISNELLGKFEDKKRADILGRKICDFLDEELGDKLKKDFDLISTTQKTIIFPRVNFRGGKEKFDFLLTPIYYPDNRIKGFKIILEPHFLSV